ncbi:helix-turn-helix protein [Amycolatopsis echigonensis]|uniref:Helix-turn-helix protein n=1 Tax=Amycolatopsis echigonensis TaxID=2576905 RepID=A0A2N3WLL0_9PSEU|nr:Scr1 family TA system antitoxin-like transcriptional regulator [Amycolatopsis niigatensis]PKV94745.1 helix-turn-helix protein [Amycolatopsis niigatensis]
MTSKRDTLQPSPRHLLLGAVLHAQRRKADKTLREVANLIHKHHAQVAQWELGVRKPDAEHVGGILCALSVAPDDHAYISSLARTTDHSVVILHPAHHRHHAEARNHFTQRAKSFVDYHPTLVPASLWTSDYARVVLKDLGAAPGCVSEFVKTQAEQRRLLRTPTAETRRKQVEVFLGEPALSSHLQAPEVTCSQLRFLRALEKANPMIRVRIVPSEICGSPALQAPFTCYETAAGPVTYFAHHSAGVFAPDHGAYRRLTADLRLLALPTTQSRKVIDDRIRNLERLSPAAELAQPPTAIEAHR